MRAGFFISGLILTIFLASPVRAQVLLDASKITCDQFVHSKVGPPRLVAAWLSGFYNGKRNNVVLDSEKFQSNLSKLENFCYDEKNFKVSVMRALERVMESAK